MPGAADLAHDALVFVTEQGAYDYRPEEPPPPPPPPPELTKQISLYTQAPGWHGTLSTAPCMLIKISPTITPSPGVWVVR